MPAANYPVLGTLLSIMIAALVGCDTRAQRSDNLKQIGQALHSYHSAYRQFPSADGWCAAVAPYVENETKEKLPPLGAAEQLPACFQSNSENGGETNIFAIVGPNSVFPPPPTKAIKFRDVLDGLAATICMIELPNRDGVSRDDAKVTADDALVALQQVESGDVAHVLMCDGSVIPFVSEISPALFGSLVTRDGGEPIESLLQ